MSLGVLVIMLVAERPEHPLQHDLGEAVDRVERGPQLVAHVGQELGFGPIGELRALLGVAQALDRRFHRAQMAVLAPAVPFEPLCGQNAEDVGGGDPYQDVDAALERRWDQNQALTMKTTLKNRAHDHVVEKAVRQEDVDREQGDDVAELQIVRRQFGQMPEQSDLRAKAGGRQRHHDVEEPIGQIEEGPGEGRGDDHHQDDPRQQQRFELAALGTLGVGAVEEDDDDQEREDGGDPHRDDRIAITPLPIAVFERTILELRGQKAELIVLWVGHSAHGRSGRTRPCFYVLVPREGIRRVTIRPIVTDSV